MPSDLDFLIMDLEDLDSQSKMNTLTEDKINELISEALALMGIRTIGDTNQSKSIFVDMVKTYFNRDISWIYSTPTDIWGNSDVRGVGNYPSYTVAKNMTKGISADLEMEDYGLAGQEYYGTSNALANGGEYPSPLRLGSQYRPRHISQTMDEIDNGAIASIEKIIDDIEYLIVQKF